MREDDPAVPTSQRRSRSAGLLMLGVWSLLSVHQVAAGPDAVTRRPNVILIVADDLGYGELGCYGQAIIKTPHLDGLAEKGMRFTQFYAGSPVCAPLAASC